jgi:DNA helicase-2/ATP-dependent DNA helicase PcrA
MAAKWESLTDDDSPKITGSLRARFMGVWDAQRALLGYTLVSEIPYRLHEALLSHPDLNLGDLKTLIVDEYQDLNACDLSCLAHLAQRGITLIAVGDDDQSIYGFRKAHPAGIRDFVAQYSAADYQLTVNHRCGRRILSWAESVIQRDFLRPQKAPVTPGPGNREGEVAYLEFAGEVSEARGIATAIKLLHERRGVPFNEILVLARTDNVNGPIGKELAAQGIPFKYPDELAAILDERNVRLSLATLRLAARREDSLAWWTILHLAAGVGVGAVDALMASARDSGSRFGTHLLTLAASQDMIRVAGNRAADVVRSTLDTLGTLSLPDVGPWGEWIREQVRANRIPTVHDDVLALLAQIDGFTETSVDLERYLGQLRPMTKDLATTLKADAVRVMTMASSKGLTARACIIAGCEDNIIPHPQARRDEELRLLYVAMTRPQEVLLVTRARTRRGVTARVGRASVRNRRTICPFLEGGPVAQQDGDAFLAAFM